MAKAFQHPVHLDMRRGLITLGFIVMAIYLLIQHADILQRSLHAALQAHLLWMVSALGLTLLTFALAAGIYRVLSLKPLRYAATLLVELASAFTNRLLPAGLGSLGLHGLYLYKQRHSAAQATAVVSVNNLLGMAVHICMLVGLFYVWPGIFRQFTSPVSGFRWWYVWTLLVALVVCLMLPPLRRRLALFIHNLLASLRLLRLVQLTGAVGLAALLTLVYTLILFCSAQAVNLHLGLLQIFVVFSLGMLVGTATPTPGGLVGVEAGLFAGFVGYGASEVAAGAAVLMYRLFTYWLPLVPGVCALLVVRRRRLI